MAYFHIGYTSVYVQIEGLAIVGFAIFHVRVLKPNLVQ